LPTSGWRTPNSTVAYYRQGSAASRLSPSDIDATYVVGAKVLHLTGITPALSASCREATFAAAEVARAAGVRVVLDPNMRRKLWSDDEARATLRDLAARADVVLPGADGGLDGIAEVIGPRGVKPAPQPQFEGFMALGLDDFHGCF